MGTDEEGHAGTPGARAGGVFAGPLPSELKDGPSKLRSIRFANDLHWPRPSAEDGLARCARRSEIEDRRSEVRGQRSAQ